MLVRKETARRRIAEIVEIVKNTSGGNGVEHFYVAEDIRQWGDCSDEYLNFKDFYVALDYVLPAHIWRQINGSVGFRTIASILIGKRVFYICVDCCAPLLWEERSEGCPYCGDTFPDKGRRVVLK